VSHPNELPLEVISGFPSDAIELARLWVDSKRSYVAVGYPDRWTPELIGSLLVESAYTVATAYAAQTEMSEEEALEAIWRGFDEERERMANGD
jgi:hypothetical protein